MKKKFLSILMLCLISVFAYAQNDFQTGLIIDNTSDAAYQDAGTLAKDFSAGGKNGELPLKSNLKEYCPPIQSQGRIGSCVGWATGYGAMSILYAKKYNWSAAERAEKAFSALYIYNQIKVRDCSLGSRIDQAVNFLETNGNIPSSQFDMPREDCDKQPTTGEKAIAQKFKVKASSTLFTLNADNKTKIYNTKKSVAKGVPVIIGMEILRNFGSLTKSASVWDPSAGNTAPWGGHAMVVIGYDEGRQAFEIMNSWGTNWGNDGFIWVKYADYARFCKYGYQIFLDEAKEEPKPDEPKPDDPKPADPVVILNGSFYYRFPIFDENNPSDEIQFENAVVTKKGDYTYEMKRKDWEAGQMFQLLAKNLKRGSYVYVFSIDANKKAMVHWPRNKGLSQEFAIDGLTEKPLVPYSGETIIVPGEGTALVKEVSGTDHVFILYSNEELTNIKNIIQSLRTSSDFEGALEGELGGMLIPANEVNYYDGEMKFSVRSSSGGFVVPIILEQEGE
jgi:hypothetical protein